MNELDDQPFKELMAGIGEVYSKKISGELLATYWNVLKAYDFEEVSRAANAHMMNPESGQFLPKPADFMRYLEGDSDSRALVAWSKVEKTISGVGAYDSIVFDDALIMRVISEMGGWIDLCSMQSDELPFKRNEFVKRYRGYLLTPPQEHPKKLIGRLEADNAGQFPESVPEPILIGNSQLALEVYNTGSKQITQTKTISQVLESMAGLEHLNS